LNENQINEIIIALKANNKLIGLIKHVTPTDIVKMLVQDHDLCPKDAAQVAMGLLAKEAGMPASGIEPTMSYPISKQFRNTKKKHFEDEFDFVDEKKSLNEIQPNLKSVLTPGFTVQKHQFSQQPRGKPSDWPYDDASVAYSKNKHKPRHNLKHGP